MEIISTASMTMAAVAAERVLVPVSTTVRCPLTKPPAVSHRDTASCRAQHTGERGQIRMDANFFLAASRQSFIVAGGGISGFPPPS